MIAGVLMRQALLLAAVIDENDEEIGQYAALGIECLNDLIQSFCSLGADISYQTNVSINIQANVYKYPVVPAITEILEAQIITPLNVVYPLQVATDKQYNLWNFTSPINQPAMVYLSRVQYKDPVSGEKGSLLYFYPLPGDAYTVNLITKVVSPELEISTELNDLFPAYVRRYFKYALARDFINEYGTKPTDDFYPSYREAKTEFEAANPQDLSIQNDNPLQQRRLYKPWSYYVG